MSYDEFPFGPGLSINELTDTSNECRHGRLPFDPSPACGCWKGWEGVAVRWLPVKSRVRLCECGCGERPARGRRFVAGHNHFKKRAA